MWCWNFMVIYSAPFTIEQQQVVFPGPELFWKHPAHFISAHDCVITSWLFLVTVGVLDCPGVPDLLGPCFFWVPLCFPGYIRVGEWPMVCPLTHWWSCKIPFSSGPSGDPECKWCLWTHTGIFFFLSSPSWAWTPHRDYDKPWSSSASRGFPGNTWLPCAPSYDFVSILVFLIMPCWSSQVFAFPQFRW